MAALTNPSSMASSSSSSDCHSCLVCLEKISSRDFETGQALQLQCACRGDLALRHSACAAEWAKIKGTNVCEVCGQTILNVVAPAVLASLPAVVARARRRTCHKVGKRRKAPLVKRVARKAVRGMVRLVCCIGRLPDEGNDGAQPGR